MIDPHDIPPPPDLVLALDPTSAPGEASAAQDILWLGRLRRALTRDGFVLFAQPIVDIHTRHVVRHELLIRMQHESGRLIAPDNFMPTAERYGLVNDVDRWVIHQAAGFAARGHAVQVNVSGGALADPDLGAYAEREIALAGADAVLLSFEITETAVARNEALATAFVDRVRALGCRVALDDFGSGYGGFSYLKRFGVDCLKIDREFIADLVADAASAHVVSAVVQLATAFGVETVAEGVEDHATLERLDALGVHQAQGFLFARPVPAAHVFRSVVPSLVAAE